MISRRCFLVLLTVLVTSPVWGQDFVYILPSKEIAETGEDLWFKAYLLDRQSFALSDRSQTLYLQVRSEKDSLVWSEKYPLVDGRGEGHVYIGEDWPLGEYFLEGYARSSFTIDRTQAIRPRRIRVVDRVTQMDSITAQAVKDVSIQKAGTKHRFDLFPEGGSLVEGVSSVVAFKATYGDGFPEEVSGKVLEDGQQIAEILCLHDGMGQFIVTPRQGKNYRVVLDDGREFPLPDVEQDGIPRALPEIPGEGRSLLFQRVRDQSGQHQAQCRLPPSLRLGDEFVLRRDKREEDASIFQGGWQLRASQHHQAGHHRR